ncbi:EpsG family protein [Klebsiella michiganensis]|nr:EpsG family protein [Klebsiella michiganensis]
MKISKDLPLLFIASMLNPFIAILGSIFLFNKKNAKGIIIILSIIVFFITIKIPPWQDLYRRFLDTYMLYNESTTYMDAIRGHVDILFYVNALLFYKIGLPFYFIPAIYSSLSFYLFATTILNVIGKEKEVTGDYRTPNIKLLFFFAVSFVDIILLASTLRFLFSVALVVRGVSLLLIEKKTNRGILFSLLACITHSAMILVLMAVIGSFFVRLSKLQTILLALIFYFTSSTLLPYVFAHFNPFGLANYFIGGYVDTDLSEFGNNTNKLIVSSYKTIVLLFCLFFYLRRDGEYKRFDNFIRVFIVISCITSVSATAFGRYILGVLPYLAVLGFCYSYSALKIKKSVRLIILAIIFLNVVFVNIYLERRQIVMAGLWSTLYVPSVLLLSNYSADDFRSYLGQIDNDGNWIKDRVSNEK